MYDIFNFIQTFFFVISTNKLEYLLQNPYVNVISLNVTMKKGVKAYTYIVPFEPLKLKWILFFLYDCEEL